ncbi:MAG: DNA alkylation repair protein [Pleomorphochaeta sp.]
MKKRELDKILLLESNKKQIEFSNKLKLNDKYKILGIKTNEIKNISKQLSLNEGISHIDDFLNYTEPLIYEEVLISYFTFSFLSKKIDQATFYSYLDKLLKYNNSWSTNDTIALAIKPRKKDLSSYFEYLSNLLKSENLWDIRFAVVSLMKSYLIDEYIEKTLMLFLSVKSEEYYVEMALGWAFATALAKQRDITYPYIFGKKINNRVNKIAIQKSIESRRISESDKIELKKLRNEINSLL